MLKHELLALDSVSRDGELRSNSTLPFWFLFSLSPPPPPPSPYTGLPTWPTKICCVGRSEFSHRISLLTHIGVWFYLLAAVVVTPTWKLILAFNNPGFFVDASSEAFFGALLHFLSQSRGLDCCHLSRLWVLLYCICSEDSGFAKAYAQWDPVNLQSFILSQTRNNFFFMLVDE